MPGSVRVVARGCPLGGQAGDNGRPWLFGLLGAALRRGPCATPSSSAVAWLGLRDNLWTWLLQLGFSWHTVESNLLCQALVIPAKM